MSNVTHDPKDTEEVAQQQEGATGGEAAATSAPAAGPAISTGLMARKIAGRATRGELQMKASGARGTPGDGERNTAERGFAGEKGALPFQADMERSFGRSFSGVESHSGPAAKAANDALGSEAYAVGNKVAFRSESPSKHVVAHELAHTVQQQGGSAVQTYDAPSRDHLEAEADSAADAAVAGEKADVRLRTAGGVHKFMDGAKKKVGQWWQGMKDGWDTAKDMASILSNLDIHPIDGKASIDVDAAKLFFYLRPLLSEEIALALNPVQGGGANKVHLAIDLWGKQLTVTSPQLEVQGANFGNAYVSSILMKGFHLSGWKTNATLSVESATARTAVFGGAVKGGQKIRAQQLDLQGLQAFALKGGNIGALLKFSSVKIVGVVYPGMAPVDLEIQQAGLSLTALGDLLAKSPPQQGKPTGTQTADNKGKGATTAAGDKGKGQLDAAPSVLPPGARVKILVAGIRGSATVSKGAKGDIHADAAGGGLDHCRIAIVSGDKELAFLDVKGFKAVMGPKGVQGSMKELVLWGDPDLSRAMLHTPEVQANPLVTQVVDVVSSLGLQAAAGGAVTLKDVGVEAGEGKVSAKGSLTAHIEAPGTGFVDVALRGFQGEAKDGHLGANFDRFEARLMINDAKGSREAAFIGMDGAGGTDEISASKESLQFSPKNIQVRGDGKAVSNLMDAVAAKHSYLPDQIQAVFKMIRMYGVKGAADGAITLTRDKDGRIVTKGNVTSRIDTAIGHVDIAVTGVEAESASAEFGLNFDHFEAKFISNENKELAFVSVEGSKDGDELRMSGKTQGIHGASRAFHTRGDLAALVKAIDSKPTEMPKQVKSVFSMIRSFGLSASMDGTLDVTMTGKTGKTVARGDVSSHIEAAGVGSIDLKVVGLETSPGDNGAQVNFTRFTATLREPAAKGGKEAARLSIEGAPKGDELNANSKGAAIQARNISASGDAEKIAAMVGAIDAKASVLPPGISGAFSALRTYAGVMGSGEVKVSDLSVNAQKNGKLTAKGNLAAHLDTAEGGLVDLKVIGVAGDATKKGAGLNFDRFQASFSLPDDKGVRKEVAFFAVDGSKKGDEVELHGADDIGFRADKVEMRGDAGHVGALFANVKSRADGLSPGIAAAFDLVKAYGIDAGAKGSVVVTDVAGAKKDGEVSGKGSIDAVLQTEMGTIKLGVTNFTGHAGKTGAGVNFDRFSATLLDGKGAEAAYLLVDGASEGDKPATGGPQDFAFKAKKIEAHGHADAVANLLASIDAKMKSLPDALRNAYQVVRANAGTLNATGTLTMGNVDAKSVDGKLTVKGDLEGAVEIPELGQLKASVKGFSGGTEGGGFTVLDVKLTKGGKVLASIEARGVEAQAGAGGLSGLKISSFSVHGDAKKMLTALDPAILAKMPKQVGDALALLDHGRISASAGNIEMSKAADGSYQAKADNVTLAGAVEIVDKSGKMYVCDNATLTAFTPNVRLSSEFKLLELRTGKMEAAGQFYAGSEGGAGNLIDGKLMCSAVHVVMSPDGKPKSVEVGDIQASGRLLQSKGSGKGGQPTSGGTTTNVDATKTGKEQGGAPSKDQRNAEYTKKVQQAQGGASLVKHADIDTHTPMVPGEWGEGFKKIGVPAETTLDVHVLVQDHKLVPGETRVGFSQALDLPLWLGLGGAYLEKKGQEGALKVDLRGFFDINVSKQLGGKKTMSLDLAELVGQVMEHQRAAALEKEGKKAPSPEVQSKPQQGGSSKPAKPSKLQEEHDEWQQDKFEEELEHRNDLKELEADRDEDLAALERKIAQAGDDNRRAKLQRELEEKRVRYQRKREELLADQKKDMDKIAGKEPRSTNIVDLFGPKGIEVMKTRGDASVTVASEQKDQEVVPGILLPQGAETTLTGHLDGGGSVALTADKAEAFVYGNHITAGGLSTGDVSVTTDETGSEVTFSSFYLRQLKWEAPPDAGQKDEK